MSVTRERIGNDRISTDTESGRCFKVEYGYYDPWQVEARSREAKAFAARLNAAVKELSLFQRMSMNQD